MNDINKFFEIFNDMTYICGAVFGDLGTGKTDFAGFKLFEELTKGLIKKPDKDFIVLSNIYVFNNEPSWYRKVYSDYEVFLNISTIKNKKIFIIIDEAGLDFLSIKGAGGIENLFITQLIPLVRKLNANIIFIYQFEQYLQKTIYNFNNFIIKKESLNTVKIKIKYNNEWYIFNFETTPTSINFDTKALAGFDLFLNIKNLYSMIRKLSSIEAITKLKEILLNKDKLPLILNKQNKDLFYEILPDLKK